MGISTVCKGIESRSICCGQDSRDNWDKGCVMGGLCSGHCIVVPPGVKNSHFPGDMRRDT